MIVERIFERISTILLKSSGGTGINFPSELTLRSMGTAKIGIRMMSVIEMTT